MTRGWRTAVYPAAGFAAAGLAAAAPGSPVGPGRWPVRGPFGAFTWSAWFVSAGLGLSLAFLAAAVAVRRGGVRGASGAALGRVVPAAAGFGLLALAAYAAAAGADRIVQSPLAALTVALAGLVALRAVAARANPPRGG